MKREGSGEGGKRGGERGEGGREKKGRKRGEGEKMVVRGEGRGGEAK